MTLPAPHSPRPAACCHACCKVRRNANQIFIAYFEAHLHVLRCAAVAAFLLPRDVCVSAVELCVCVCLAAAMIDG